MSEDKIRYHILVLEAMRGVVRSVLQRVQRRGLPGDHHFYIAFDTQAPGVGLSKRLKERYPSEMTIVLQHTYQDLNVLDDRFEVRLFFANIPERLVVPFSAIKSFADPSVPFALDLSLFSMGARSVKAPATPSTINENVEAGTGARSLPPQSASPQSASPEAAPAEEAPAAAPAPAKQEDEERPGAKVVDLDRFRKK